MATFSRSGRAVCLAIAFSAIVFFSSAHGRDAAAASPDTAARPQTPLVPFPYRVDEVQVSGAAPGVALAGTLTLPFSTQPLPAVVLVHGSGPTDRDSTANGHKPFLVMADALTRAGYAVLRYDKRGVGQSTGDGRAATTLDLAADAAAVVGHLQGRREIDPNRVAVVGHSEGGTIAALLCGGPQPPAACLSLAGMVAPFSEQMPRQEILTGADLGADVSYAAAVNEYYAEVSSALSTDDDAQQRLKHMEAISARWHASFPAGHVNHDAAAESLLRRPKLLASGWFKTYMQLDVAAAIKRSRAPMFFVNGLTDRQVIAEPNLAAARAALGPDTRLRRTLAMPGINHTLQESETGSSTEYASIDQTVSPAVLRAVTGFLADALGPVDGQAGPVSAE